MFTLEAVPEQSAGAVSPVPFVASFLEDRDPGHVVGRSQVDGIDVEALISADHGALRLTSPARPGWGRAVVSWGPYPLSCGLTASIIALAGAGRAPGRQAGGTTLALLTRLRRDGVAAGRDGLGRWLFDRWEQHRRSDGEAPAAGLAIGLLGAAHPVDAAAGGAAFRLQPAQGTLTLAVGHPDATEVVAHLAAVRHQLVIIVREHGALYAVGSWPADGGGPATVRPLLVDPTALPATVWAGVHHGGLGDPAGASPVRIDDVRVARPVEFTNWWTTALVADRHPTGHCGERAAAHGGAWQCAALAPGRELLIVPTAEAVGVTHAVVRIEQAEERVGLAVRVGQQATAHNSGWLITSSLSATVAERYRNAIVEERHHAATGLTLAKATSIQVLDDGGSLLVLVDGRPVLGPLAAGESDATAVGLRRLAADAGEIIEFEAHPRRIELPAELRVDLAPPAELAIERLQDRFELRGNAFVDPDWSPLAGRVIGDRHWQQTDGSTPFRLDGAGATAAVRMPGGRGRRHSGFDRWRHGGEQSICTVAWSDPASAELAISLVAPGGRPGLDERRPGGLVFQQDRDHRLIVQSWRDGSGAIWVESSLQAGGYDHGGEAIRTTIGSHLAPAEPYDLRVTFDGTCYVVFVDGAPVLYRRTTDLDAATGPLRIERVGIVAGGAVDDGPGPKFLRFTAATAIAGATTSTSEQSPHAPRREALPMNPANTTSNNLPTEHLPTEHLPTAHLRGEQPTTAIAAKDDRV